MTIVIPDGYGEVVLEWTFTGKTNPVTVTLGVRQDGGALPNDIVNDIYTDVSGTGCPCHANEMTPDWTFVGVHGIFMELGIPTGWASTGPAIVGTHAAAATPTMNTSMLIQKRTGIVGRKYRGRMYWPNLLTDEGAIDPLGNLSSGFYSAYKALVDTMTANIFANANYSPFLLHNDSTPPTEIFSMPLQSRVFTQRRRMR